MYSTNIKTLQQRREDNLNAANSARLNELSENFTPDEQRAIVKHISNDILVGELAYRLSLLEGVNDGIMSIAGLLSEGIQY